MARSRQEAAIKAQEALAAELVPGTIVVARVRGFPPWPAMVVKESDVPPDVVSVRPSKKIVVPVLFYNDSSFQWVAPGDTELLLPEHAAKFAKAKAKKQLKDAYAIAANPPTYEDALATLFNSVDAPAHEAKTESRSKPTPRRARSAAERALSAPVPKPKRAKLETDDDSEYFETGTSTSTATSTEGTDGTETGSEEVSGTEFSTKTLARSLNARFELCCAARRIIQELLLREAPLDDKEAASCVEIAEQVHAAAVEVSVLRRSRLSRVVNTSLQLELRPEVRVALEKVAEMSNTIAENIIRGIPEHLVTDQEREASETPEPGDRRSESPVPDQIEASSEVGMEEAGPESEKESEVTKAEPVEPVVPTDANKSEAS